MPKTYKLLGQGGAKVDSTTPGQLGGNSRTKLYGRLDCPAANNALAKRDTYAAYRVFFADEAAAVAAGYRPCGVCLREQHKKWNAGGAPGTADYPWLQIPKNKKPTEE